MAKIITGICAICGTAFSRSSTVFPKVRRDPKHPRAIIDNFCLECIEKMDPNFIKKYADA